MKVDPCNICGATDVNLVDGYYYCVECGTQDVNVRETVIEYTVQQDGTFAHMTTKKIVATDAVEMTAEWHKWHTYNFILTGFADELIALGAQHSFKVKLLWIWTRYIKKYAKDGDESTSGLRGFNAESTRIADSTQIGEDRQDHLEFEDFDDIDQEDSDNETETHQKAAKTIDLSTVTLSVLHAMVYIALNFDGSDIQLSDLVRFIREGKLSSDDCIKYVPKELKTNKIDGWTIFKFSRYLQISTVHYRLIAMLLIKTLHLGKPRVPNLFKLVKRYIVELCLPNDMQDFVFSIIRHSPIDVSVRCLKDISIIPDFESIAMSYILIAMKIAFGLDDRLDRNLSQAIENINAKENHRKCYKFSMFLEKTNRLFNFNEWAEYIQYRTIILASYSYFTAKQKNIRPDIQTFISQTLNRYKIKNAASISDEILMDVLGKIPCGLEEFKRLKIEFPNCLTPLTTKTDVILTNLDDIEVKELLGQDFRQYSLKYIQELNLKVNGKNLAHGVAGEFEIKPDSKGFCDKVPMNREMVYVRNCENKNWLITKPPKLKHIDEGLSDESQQSDIENNDEQETSNTRHENLVDLEHLDENTNIFNDDFNVEPENIFESCQTLDDYENLSFTINTTGPSHEIVDNLNEEFVENLNEEYVFDPSSFNREEAIKQLIDKACKEYKIRIPKPDTEPKKRKPYKRKPSNDLAVNNRPKRSRNSDYNDNSSIAEKPAKAKKGEAKRAIDEIVMNYKNLLARNKFESSVFAIIREELNASTNSQNDLEVNAETHNNTENDNNLTNIDTLGLGDAVNENHSVINENLIDAGENDISSDKNPNNIPENDVNENQDDEVMPKINPKFDPEIYDIKQLYLKPKYDDIDQNENSSEKDSVVENIFSKQDEKNSDIDENISKHANYLSKINAIDGNLNDDKEPNEIDLINYENASDKTISNTKTESNSDDEDIPLSVYYQNKINENRNDNCKPVSITRTELNSDDESIPLNVYFQNKINENRNDECNKLKLKDLGPYWYWVRHYDGRFISYYRKCYLFEKELNNLYPKSFSWLLRTCADILEVRPSFLYNELIRLEQYVFII